MDEKSKLYKDREKYRQKAFWMMLEIGVIIAVPAFVAFFIGRSLSNTYRIGLLFISFFISWAVIIYKYAVFSKRVKEVDKKIKELKENDRPDNSR